MLAPHSPDWLEASTIRHWAGLLLARVDGKSPVEYIKDPASRQTIRDFARNLIAEPARAITDVFERRLRCP